MDIKVLQYFLAVAREESITGAAESLHMTQPPLSRQLKELEDELGKQLLIRGKRKVTLTDDGIFLRKRAEEIVELFEKTKTEMMSNDEIINGDIHIGGGETEGVRLIARVTNSLRKDYPYIHFHLHSGNADDITERLDRGLLDFGIFIEPADMRKYDFIRLPAPDTWGVLMRKDSPLAAKKAIRPEDLIGLPIISSSQGMVKNEIAGWLGGEYERLNIVATYNLLFNASIMVEEGNGYALCLDKIIKITQDGILCFRPLEPKLEVGLAIAWKKHQVFSKAAEKFLMRVKDEYAGVSECAHN